MLPVRVFSEDYSRRSLEALTLALETVPAYQNWKPLDPGAQAAVDVRYAALPELTKKEMRESFPQGLVPPPRRVEEGLSRKEIEYIQTSGTTSERVTNIWYQPWWNASETASWKLNVHTADLDGSQREAQLTSAMNVGVLAKGDLPLAARTLERFLFLNEKRYPGEWTDFHYRRMAQELEMFQPRVLEGNPSWLAWLAQWALQQGRKLYSPPVILLTYENPWPVQLRLIREAFQAPLASSFGTTETGYVLMQCEHGLFHQNTEFCRIDFQPFKPEHGGPGLGRILVSTFGNPWAAILRFDTGDIVRLSEQPQCSCGRKEGLLAAGIEGRVANATFTTDGRLVTTTQVDLALARVADVRDYHLEQNSPNTYTLKLVTFPEARGVLDGATAALRALYGPDAVITASLCQDIEPGPSGKYRRTWANFEFDPKGLLA